MNLQFLFKAIAVKAKKKSKNRKLIATSYVSLFLVALFVVISVTAWFTASSSVNLVSSNMSMRGASGMRNDKDKKSLDEIVIEDFKLEEASSVDGRNIFFPTSMFGNASDNSGGGTKTVTVPSGTGTNGTKTITVTKDPSSQTASLVYRDATAGDKKQRYAYAEAALNSAADNTNVWIRGYKVVVGDDVYQDYITVDNSGSASSSSSVLDMQKVPQDCPVRIAIISDSGDDFKVIDPSAIVKDYAINTNAVYSITAEGAPTQRRTNLDAFSSFYYGTRNPLFVLDAGESKDIAVIAWLEGSHPNARNYEGKTLSVEITIETNVSDMGMIYFHDYTAGDDAEGVTKSNYRDAADNWTSNITHAHTGHWLSNDNAIIVMSYYDTVAETYKTAPMSYLPKNTLSDDGVVTAVDDYTYCAAIPSYVTTNISFYRLAPFGEYETNPRYILKGNIYNAWHTKSGINSQLSTTAASWKNTFGLGNMLESRTKGSETYWHYFAIRGNGYGVVDSTGTQRYLQWLSPCIGFWGGNSGTVVGASGQQNY